MDTSEYWKNGIQIIEGFIDSNEISALTLEAESVRNAKYDNFKPIINIHRQSEFFTEFSFNKKYESVVSSILENANISLLQTQYFFSPPKTPGFNCHQDNSFVRPEKTESFLTTWLPLTDISKENGALYYYPEMHNSGYFERVKKGCNNHEEKNSLLTAQSEELVLPTENKDAKPHIIEVQAGSLVLIHGMTPHGSFPNNSQKSRPVYLSNYIISGIQFNPGSDGKRVEQPTNWNLK